MKEKTIDSLAARLQKYGLKPFIEDDNTAVKYWIPTGILPLDKMLGGGLPAGKITEIYGLQSSYKSGLSERIMETCVYMHGISILYDNEQAFDPNKSRLPSFDKQFYHEFGKNVIEDFYPHAKHLLETINQERDCLTAICWDSLPATLPRETMDRKDEDIGKRQISRAAALHSECIPWLVPVVRESTCAFVIVNQCRAKMNPMPWEDKTTTPGGYGLRFYAGIRLSLKYRGDFFWAPSQKGANPPGWYIEAETEKNKFVPPNQKVTFPLIFDDNRGGDPAIAYLEWAEENGYANKSGRSKYDLSAIVPGLQSTRRKFHEDYLANLDACIDFFGDKTGFKYGADAREAVKALTINLYKPLSGAEVVEDE